MIELQTSTLPIAAKLAAGVRPAGWEAALRLLATTSADLERSSPGTPVCLVIDELPWLARAVVAAVGAGETEFTRVLSRSGVGRTSLSAALKTLAEKHIISRHTPFASAEAPLVGVSRTGFAPHTRLDVELGPEELLAAEA